MYVLKLKFARKIEKGIIDNIKEKRKYNCSEYDEIKNLIMKKSSVDYFYHIKINSKPQPDETERLEKYKKIIK